MLRKMLAAGNISMTDNPLIDMIGESAQVELHMLHKSITSDVTFKCGVSVSRRIGVALADYFSTSLPRSINSDTNTPPPPRGYFIMFSRSHLNYFGIFRLCQLGHNRP